MQSIEAAEPRSNTPARVRPTDLSGELQLEEGEMWSKPDTPDEEDAMLVGEPRIPLWDGRWRADC
jgi:hypothetical protein